MWFGVAIGLALITFCSLSKRQKDLVLQRLRIRGRRISTAETPPRSLSPEKDLTKEKFSPASEYATVFPPSQRHLLPTLIKDYPSAQQALFGDLQFDEAAFQKNILGWEEDYRDADPSTYTYTGFSMREIKALGDFPDYSTLTEVPPPEPYNEFDIDRAIPRPYRPFRWAYHQTMCELGPDVNDTQIDMTQL